MEFYEIFRNLEELRDNTELMAEKNMFTETYGTVHLKSADFSPIIFIGFQKQIPSKFTTNRSFESMNFGEARCTFPETCDINLSTIKSLKSYSLAPNGNKQFRHTSTYYILPNFPLKKYHLLLPTS